MADLYIKINGDNSYSGHPQLKSEVKRLFPKHDFNSGPPIGYLEFVRITCPTLGVYQTFDDSKGADLCDAYRNHNGLTYEIVDGKYQDVWHVRAMTADEKAAKIQSAKDEWAKQWVGCPSGNSTWVFNETTCDYEPPTSEPSPVEGKVTVWSEKLNDWQQLTPEELAAKADETWE